MRAEWCSLNSVEFSGVLRQLLWEGALARRVPGTVSVGIGVSIGQLPFMLGHVFGNGQNALESIEVDSVGGISGKLDVA